MYYIQEIDKPSWLKRAFNIITLNGDKIILPITQEQKFTERQAQKLSNKIVKILDKTSCKKIVISKKTKSEQNFINYLYTYNLQIPTGNWLFEVLSYDTLDYIIKKKSMKKEETQISILINYLSEYTIANLKKLVKEYKRVNIVTNNFSRFKNIEKEILDKYGIMITVTNNKKRSLLKSSIILNIDFPTELINKYNIYDEAIIVNICKDVKIKKKRFNGININDYEIKISNQKNHDNDILQLYDFKDVYEATFYKRQPYGEIIKKLKKDGVYIEKLHASNSVL